MAELIAAILAPAIRALEASVTRPEREALVDWAQSTPVNATRQTTERTVRSTFLRDTSAEKCAPLDEARPLYFGTTCAIDGPTYPWRVFAKSDSSPERLSSMPTFDA